MYATFEYYREEYLLGNEQVIPEQNFAFCEKQARIEIDARTYGRIAKNESLITDAIRDCTCAVAEVIYMARSVRNASATAGVAGVVTSWSNDGESGSVDVTGSVMTEVGCRQEVERLITQYLFGTGLMFAGARCFDR